MNEIRLWGGEIGEGEWPKLVLPGLLRLAHLLRMKQNFDFSPSGHWSEGRFAADLPIHQCPLVDAPLI